MLIAKKTLGLLSSALLLASCMAPLAPITPETIVGCWEGETFGYRARVNIDATGEERMYTMNGQASGPNAFSYNINDIRFLFQQDGELVPQNLPAEAASLPIKIRVEGGELKARLTSFELASIGLKRCAGSTTPAPASSASPAADTGSPNS